MNQKYQQVVPKKYELTVTLIAFNIIQKYEPYKDSDIKSKIKLFQAEVRNLYPPPPEFAETLIEP
jgi:hypothetical protein